MASETNKMAALQRFSDKVVIVTGAGSGIGQATAIRMATEGAAVIAVDMNAEGLAKTVAKAADLSGGVRAYTCSVASEDEVKGLIADVLKTEGRIDSLVNMAGILRSGPTTELTLDLFQQVLSVNLIGTFLCCREALPALLETKGTIVNAASTSAQFGHPYMAAYAASKGGVYALTRTLAWEYLKQGVRVNAVAPGGIMTPMVAAQGESMGGFDFDLFTHLSRPDGKFGTPESVAAVIAMLASEDGAHMTGEVVKVDGGVHN
jgi:NAD(P)-dependent dehydrogenase (short-subunit alcohol dehydrogenase family)